MTPKRRSGLKLSTKRLLLSGLTILAFAGPAMAQDPEITGLGFTYGGTYGGHDYYLTGTLAGQKGSWAAMQIRSQLIAANLVTINDALENTFVTGSLTGLGATELAWTGLRQTDNLSEPTGNWAWISGDPSAYRNFCSTYGQPDDWPGDSGPAVHQDFAAIHSDVCGGDGGWDDVHLLDVPVLNGTGLNTFQGIVEVNPCSGAGTLAASLTLTKANVPFGNGNNSPDIWLGIGPQSDVLTAAPNLPGLFNFSWTSQQAGNLALLNCTDCASPTFTPTVAGNYKFTVFVSPKAYQGCVFHLSTTVTVRDIRDPNNGSKVIICHNGHTQSVSPNAAYSPHLSSHDGDYLGPCTNGNRIVMNEESDEVKIFPNPSQNAFTVAVPHVDEAATVVVRDVQGRVIETRNVNANESHELRFDLQSMPRGLYMIEGFFGNETFHTKVVLQ